MTLALLDDMMTLFPFPSVYRYERRDQKHCLYLGEYDTVSGLELSSRDAMVTVTACFAGLDLHEFTEPMTVRQVIERLNKIGLVGLYDFQCKIGNDIDFSTHDDGECHFQFESLETCEMFVKNCAPVGRGPELWKVLVHHHGKYVAADKKQSWVVYEDFDAYLNALG